MKSHRYKLLDVEVISERSVASVTPGLCVDGHAVFPLVVEQVSWLVAISTGVISSVLADAVLAPAVIRHHRVSYRTVKKNTLISRWLRK